MENLPKFCPHCGAQTTNHRYGDNGWTEDLDCLPCRLTYHMVCGDYQGGGRNEVYAVPLITQEV